MTIAVDCENVSSFVLLLSDALVDLSKPISIKTNGEEVLSGKLPPTMPVFLETFDQYQSDPGFLYTAKYRKDVPTRKKTTTGGASGEKPAEKSGDKVRAK